MEASSTSGRIGGKWPALSGRRSGVIIAVVAAVLAGVLLYAFVQHYKKSTPTAAVSTTTAVIVSTGFIPTGTPASQVASSSAIAKSATAEPATGAGSDGRSTRAVIRW